MNKMVEPSRVNATPIVRSGPHRPLNFREPDERPVMRADEGDLARAVDRAWASIAESNCYDVWLFRHAGIPTWVVRDDEGRPIAVEVTEHRLRQLMARLADWRRMRPGGELVSAKPPLDLVRSVLATPNPDLPVLRAIVNTPVFGRNGNLVTQPGYHPDAQLLYVPTPGFALPPISANPSLAEVANARGLLCDELFGDFPFVGAPERAHAVALLLLHFVRDLIDGSTPLHLIEKPTPGTGATLMVDAIATLLTGSGASVMTEGRSEDEWRKRITAKLRQMPTTVLIDNLSRRLDSSAVAAVLTAPFWEDRILGVSDMARLPIRCTWIATGNNPEFSNEIARRFVRIRLDALEERPFKRNVFRHPRLIAWVRGNRAHLVAACLTLCQAWIAAGRPPGGRIVGSFESWSEVMGGVLEVAGIEGFLDNLDETSEGSDVETGAWAAFIEAWWRDFGSRAVGTVNLYVLALNCEPGISLNGWTDRALRTSLGTAIGKMRDRVFRVGDLRLQLKIAGKVQNSNRWNLVVLADACSSDE